MLDQSDITALMEHDQAPAVTIYLPTHTAGREIRQDPARLKNAIASARAQLVETGMRDPDAGLLLRPVDELIADSDFWRHQSRGLAIFVAPGLQRVIRVPVELPERVVVGRHFHLRPLLPLLAAEGTFFVLTMSAHRARLFQATKFGMTELDAGLPPGIPLYRESAGPSDARDSAEGPDPAEETTSDELRKQQSSDYVRTAALALKRILADRKEPIVLAADPKVEGILRSNVQLKTLVPETIQKNPDAMAEEELHQTAYAMVKPLFDRDRQAALERIHMLLGSGGGKALLEPGAALGAALEGRVDSLLLAEEEDDADQPAVPNSGAQAEMIERAAAAALRTGGAVHLVRQSEMPERAVLAASLRY